jgi:hypothetical protein
MWTDQEGYAGALNVTGFIENCEKAQEKSVTSLQLHARPLKRFHPTMAVGHGIDSKTGAYGRELLRKRWK